MLDFIQEQENVEVAASISKLDELEKVYARELRSLVSQSDEGHHHELSNIFYLLGKIYLKKADFVEDQDVIGKDLKKAECYTDAAKFYQYVISLNSRIIEDYERKDDWKVIGCHVEKHKEAIKGVWSQINEIGIKLLALVTPTSVRSNAFDDSTNDKKRLEQLRSISKQKVAEIEKQMMDIAFVQRTKDLYSHITQEIKTFLADLYKDAQTILGEPPCSYAVIGLGSMALQQITPYSDLEFAILTELNSDPKHGGNPEIQKYFLLLTHLVHFRVINLGETPIADSKYNIQLESFIKRGINFDLGGKTPLGRVDKDKPYSLIQNIEWMIRYLKNAHSGSHIDKILPSILEVCINVHECQIIRDDGTSGKSLVTDYQERVSSFLKECDIDGVSHYQSRAVQRLKDGCVERDYLEAGKPGKLEGNIYAYKPSLMGQDNHGRSFDVKQEIYRLTDRLLYDFAMYYGVESKSVWEAVDGLAGKRVISEQAKDNLLFAASFSTMLRLRVYQHYGQQRDDIAVLDSIGIERNRLFRFSREMLTEDSSLFKFYYTALPLQESLEEFLDKFQNECFNHKFYVNSGVAKAQVFLRLFQHQSACECFSRELETKEEVSVKNYIRITNTLNILGNIHGSLKNVKKQIELQEKAFAIFLARQIINLSGVIQILNDLGNAYGVLGESQSIEEQIMLQKEELKQLLTQNVVALSGVIQTLNNLGNAYGVLGESQNIKKQIMLYKVALTISIVCERDSCEAAVIMNHLGMAYGAPGENQNIREQIRLQEKALEIFIAQNNQPEMARALNNLGTAYGVPGENQNIREQIRLLKRALEIKEHFYGKNHPEVASTLVNLGGAYHKLQDEVNIRERVELYRRALAIYKRYNDNEMIRMVSDGLYDAYVKFYNCNLKQNPMLVYFHSIDHKIHEVIPQILRICLDEDLDFTDYRVHNNLLIRFTDDRILAERVAIIGGVVSGEKSESTSEVDEEFLDSEIDDVDDCVPQDTTTAYYFTSYHNNPLLNYRHTEYKEGGYMLDVAEDVRKESLRMAQSQGDVGPHSIEDFELFDVRSDGNCFFRAVADQIRRLNLGFLRDKPETTEDHDFLRGRVQGADFRDTVWTDEQEYNGLVRAFPVVLAIIDTRTPEGGFNSVRYFDQTENTVVNLSNPTELSINLPIVRIAATGNHFLSVRGHHELNEGVIRAAWSIQQNVDIPDQDEFVGVLDEDSGSGLDRNVVRVTTTNPESILDVEVLPRNKEHPLLINILFSSEEERKAYSLILARLKQANNARLLDLAALSNYQETVGCLQELGSVYETYALKVANANKNIKREYFIYASFMYNGALTIARKKGLDINDILLESNQRLYELLFREVIETEKSVDLECSYKSELERIQTEAKSLVKHLDERVIIENLSYEERSKVIDTIYSKINLSMRQLFTKVVQDAINQINLPHCKFAVILFGSFAKGLLTPYSDIEYGILIEDLGEELNKLNKEYFRDLSVLVSLRILSFGTSNIPLDMLKGYGVESGINLDDIIVPGFQLDLGGKTPLNRKRLEPVIDELTQTVLYPVGSDKYDLIATPSEMARYVHEEWFKADKLLPIEVAEGDFLIGDQCLAQDYESRIQQYLTMPISKSVNEQTQTIGQDRAIRLLQSNIATYATKLEDASTEGQLYRVKIELYRTVETIINGIALFNGLTNGSIWSKIEKLKKQQVINQKAEINLKIALGISMELRLRAYLSRESQKETFSIFPETISLADIQEAFCIPNLELLYRFYYTVFPLQRKIQECLKDQLPIANEDFFDDGNKIKGLVYLRFLQYDKAVEALQLAALTAPQDYQVILILSSSLLKLSRYDQAITHLAMIHDSLTMPEMVEEKNLIQAKLYEYLNRYKEAELAYNNIIASSSSSKVLATAYNGLGIVYGKQNKHEEALRCFVKINEFVLKGEPLITNLNNIAVEEGKLGNHDRAIAKYNEALAVCRTIYQQIHPKVAKLFSNIASEYHDKFIETRNREYADKSINNFLEALTLYRVILRNDNEEILTVTYNIANIYFDTERYSEALDFYTKTSRIITVVQQTNFPPRIFLNMGKCLSKLERYQVALMYLHRAKSLCAEGDDLMQSITSTISSTNFQYVFDLIRLDKFEDALIGYRDFRRRPSTTMEQLAKNLFAIGEALIKRNEYVAALETLLSAEKLARFVKLESQFLECRKSIELASKGAIENGYPDKVRAMLDKYSYQDPRKQEEIEILKKAISKKSSEIADLVIENNPPKLVEIFQSLGDLYYRLGVLDNNPEHLTEAAKHYQYVISISEREIKKVNISPVDMNVYEIAKATASSQLQFLYRALIKIVGGNIELSIYSSISEETQRDKFVLEELRERSKIQLLEIDGYLTATEGILLREERDKVFIERTRSLFECIATEMRSFLANLYRDVQKILGESPCSYSVIGLGSMALQQITPYSDLEFAILTENDDYKQNTDFRVNNYFIYLTHLVHFRIISLGETAIPTSQYSVNLDSFIIKGIRLDLGGKTPLGRIDKHYSLIGTPEIMVEFLKEEYWSNDKFLPSILEICTGVYEHTTSDSAHRNLIKVYRERVEVFLRTRNHEGLINHESRSIKRLSKGIKESATSTITKLLGNLDAYKPQLVGQMKEGKPFDAKQEIFRLVDRLLYDLAFYYGIEPTSIWDAVDQLKSKEIISEKEAFNLLYAASFANTLRLRTYTHYNQQKEDIEVLSVDEETQIFRLSEKDLREEGNIFRFYYTVLPLYELLQRFVNVTTEIKQLLLSKCSFYNEGDKIKAFIHARLFQYKNAIWYLEKHIVNNHGSASLKAHTEMGVLYLTIGGMENLNRAISIFSQILQKCVAEFGCTHTEVAVALTNLGITHVNIGDRTNIEKGIRYLSRALEIQRGRTDKSEFEIAKALMNLSGAYASIGDKGNLIRTAQDLKIQAQAMTSKDSTRFAILTNLGKICVDLGDNTLLTEVLPLQNEAVEIAEKEFGKNHPYTTIALTHLAIVYGSLEHLDMSTEILKRVLKLKQAVLGDEHLEVVKTMVNLGVSYGKSHDMEEANHWLFKALSFAQVKHYRYFEAVVLSNIGNVFGEFPGVENIQKQINYQEEALKVYREECIENHVEIIKTSRNLVNAYHKLRTGRTEKKIADEGLYTEYANFLLTQNRHKEAVNYLLLAIKYSTNQSKLNYDKREHIILPSLLQRVVLDREALEVVALHYAYYLLILNYNKFIEVGVEGLESKETYIALFESTVLGNNHFSNLMLEDVKRIRDSRGGTDVVVTQASHTAQEPIFIGRVEVVYNNPLLNYRYLGSILTKAHEVGGVALVNRLMDSDQVAARAIIDTVETKGIEGLFAIERDMVMNSADREARSSGSRESFEFSQESSWFSSYLKAWIYRSEIRQLKQLLHDKGIAMSWQESLSGNNYRKISPKFHPDTGGSTKEFQFYNDFRKKFNEQNIQPIIQELQLYIHKTCHQLSVTFKALDFGVDAVRVYYKPTLRNILDLAIGGVQLLSMTTGITKASTLASFVSISYSYYENGIYEAAKSAATLGIFMVAPYALIFTNIPYAGLAYTLGMTAYTGINLANNIWSLYQELISKNVSLESAEAYQELYQIMSNLTDVGWFSDKATEYEVIVEFLKYEIQEQQGDFGTISPSPLIEEEV